MQNDVIDGALALVNKINEQVRIIESCNITMERVQESELSLLLPEGELAELEGISQEQMLEIKVYILATLGENIAKAEKFLQSLQSEPTCVEAPPEEQEPEEKVSDEDKEAMRKHREKEQARQAEEIEHPVKTIDEVQAEAQAAGMSYGKYMQKVGSCTGATRKMTVGDLENELAAGLSISQIARKYGYSNASSIINAISKHNIDVKGLTNGQSPYRLTEEDIPRIRELYTEGDKNLTETASRLGVTKKTLKAFVDEHHLTKRLR